MTGFNTLRDLREAWKDIGSITGDGRVKLVQEEALRASFIDDLAWTAALSEDAELRDAAQWLIRGCAQATGNVPSSIHDLYMACGRDDAGVFTVPAINIRGMTYDVARAVFRAARTLELGPVVLEIARSEIGYTEQRPAEYAASVLAAAVKEKWDAPVFLQGDHFQVNASKYGSDPDKELDAVKSLIREGIEAGFYQIDIDTSTLVDLGPDSLDEQQKLNYEICADFTELIRSLEPEGITVSVGGEIGEVGGKNSTVEELEAFMDGYNRRLGSGSVGISKISVQTGTSHGGVPLPDGSVAEVKVDFDTLGKLSRVSRRKYGIGGAVQHGASTLPDLLFNKFPETDTVEIHLATGFQNILFDHAKMPDDFRRKIYDHLRSAHAGEKKEGQTDEQFIYKTRKKGFGPFKKEWWNLSDEIKGPMMDDLQEKFAFLFDKLAVANTDELISEMIEVKEFWPPLPAGLAE